MLALRRAALVCLLLLAVIRLGDGLKCYTCTVCNDPFDPNDVKVEEKPDNQGYYCTKVSAAFVVKRDVSTTCNAVNVLGNGQWCCQTNFCNHTSKVKPASLLIVALIITFFIKFV